MQQQNPQASYRTSHRVCAPALAMVLVAIVAAGRASAQECIGDCNANQHVEVSELVLSVGVALGSVDADACPGLGNPSIDRVVAAVDYSINGCPGGTPPPTRTPTRTVLATPTPTTPVGPPTQTPTTGPTQGRCGNGVVEFPPIVPVGETCDPPDGPAAEERPEKPDDSCPADCTITDCNQNTPFEVNVNVSAPEGAMLAVVDAWVRYPDGDVGIRGRAGNVLGQLTFPPDASVTPNDKDFALRLTLTDGSGVGLPLDPLFGIHFQLCAATPPTADAFRCEVVTATDYNLGDVTDQTTCSVVIAGP